MKVAVMGAGAVGCYYGGMLARAGHEVTLIGRPQHVDAVRASGLLLETKEFRGRVPVHASTCADAVRGAGLVLFSVKSTDTERAGADMAPHLDAGALVLSLQNGVDNAARLQSLLRQRVAPAVVYVATEMAGAGHVRHHGRGERSEIDHLNGFVLRQGEALGVPTPVNRILHTLVKLIETSEAKAPPTSTR